MADAAQSTTQQENQNKPVRCEVHESQFPVNSAGLNELIGFLNLIKQGVEAKETNLQFQLGQQFFAPPFVTKYPYRFFIINPNSETPKAQAERANNIISLYDVAELLRSCVWYLTTKHFRA